MNPLYLCVCVLQGLFAFFLISEGKGKERVQKLRLLLNVMQHVQRRKGVNGMLTN